MKKQRREEPEKRREEERRSKTRKSQTKMQVCEKVERSQNKVRNCRKWFFQRFVAPEGRKVGSLKRRVRSQLARWEMKKCTALWRGTFRSQKVQSISLSEHFWKLRCRKSARRCGAKHISKSKVLKIDGFGALLEVELLKKRTALWREAHFQIKMRKAHQLRSTFGSWDVQKVHAVVARSTLESRTAKNTTRADFLDVEALFCAAGTRDSAPCQKWAKGEGFVGLPKTP